MARPYNIINIMKIAIISDTHDNIPNIDIFLKYIKKEKITTVIHCGDISNIETFKYLNDNIKGMKYFVFGNVDYDRKNLKIICESYKDTACFDELGEIEINNIKIAFIHFPREAKKLAKQEKYHFVFNGHTHKPWLEQAGSTVLANPGTLAGMFYSASFAVLDLEKKKIELKLLKDLK